MNTEHYDERSIWQIMHDYFKSAEWSSNEIAEFLEKIRYYVPFRDNSQMKEYYHKRTVYDPEMNKYSNERIRREAIRTLIHFGLPKRIFYTQDKFLPIPYQNSFDNSRVAFLNMSQQENKSNMIKEFSNLNVSYISGANSFLKIHDYLGKGSIISPGVSISAYLDAHHTDIFPAIVKKLQENQSFKYIRVMGLPFSLSTEKMTPHDAIVQALKECSYSLFNHICECLYLFKDRKKNKPKFIISPVPSRAFQFALIDNRYVYTEYYRVNYSRNTKPSFLTVNDATYDEDVKTIYNIYDIEIDNLSEGENWNLKAEDIEFLIEDVIKLYVDRFNNKDYWHKRDNLKDILEQKINSINVNHLTKVPIKSPFN